MPPYRGKAVDRIPAGKIQHVIVERTTKTTIDGATPPEDARELNLTLRLETWNSRTRGRFVSTLVAGQFIGDGSGNQIPQGAWWTRTR